MEKGKERKIREDERRGKKKKGAEKGLHRKKKGKGEEKRKGRIETKQRKKHTHMDR